MVSLRSAALVAMFSALISSVALDAHLDREWKLFVKTYNKMYKNEAHETQSRKIWEDNVDFIRSHNLRHDMGEESFRVGVNEYADWSLVQFRKTMNGFVARHNSSSGELFMVTDNHLPDSVDWRPKGYVTPIKNQGQCGSCWAFSSTGSLEGQHFKHTGKLVSLSEQNLVDCTHYGNAGCNGGWMDNAFKYVAANKGIDTETAYPYEAKDGDCRYNPDYTGATDSGPIDIPRGNEKALKAAVATVGPISVAIDASHRSFQLYKSGLYKEPECSNSTSDHAVLAVGYGKIDDSGHPYWLVKNSWGTSWGMDGYILMARGHNMCAIATFASYPKV